MKNKSVSMKVVVVLLAVVLTIGCTVGGTLAWLVASSNTVTNTFTVGKITLELKEHKLGTDGAITSGTSNEITASEANSYKILPGTEQPKDPFVRVKSGSENCYIFVQVQETNNIAQATAGETAALKYVSWDIASGWTLLPTEDDVSTYYRTTNYATKDADEEYAILADNKVTYSGDLTETMLKALGDNEPQLTFKAFAVQEEAVKDATGDKAAAAWGKVDANEKLSSTASGN